MVIQKDCCAGKEKLMGGIMKVSRKAVMLAAIAVLLMPSIGFGEAILMPDTTDYPYDYVPLRKIQATIQIQDQIVTTIIDQTFNNVESDATINATYCYPVPERATITGFGTWVDGNLVYYVMEPGEQEPPSAPGIRDPALVAYLGKNPFYCNIQRIATGDFTTRLEYSELMDYAFGHFNLTYPLGMGGFVVGSIDTIEVIIELNSQRSLVSVMIGNYTGEVLQQDNNTYRARVALENLAPTDHLTLEITVSQEEVGMWLFPYREDVVVDSVEDGFFLAVIEPGDVTPDQVFDKSFTFVFDRSGSMSGENRISEAKQAAVYCIEHLDPGDMFNIISFSGDINMWSTSPVLATTENVSSAIVFINGLYAAGWTNLNGAMLAAVDQEMSLASANQILLLSDGLPTIGVTYLPTIVDGIRTQNGDNVDATIFTIAVGNDSDLDFLAMIAYQNHGQAISFAPGTESLAEEIINFYQRFANPVLIDVNLDMTGIQPYDIYPPLPLNVFAGSQSVIGGRYVNPANISIELTGRVVGQTTSRTYGPFDFPEISTDYAFVPRMWAINKIDYYLAYMSVYGETQELIDMIIELSLTYGILTPFTSYQDPDDPPDVAVEEPALNLVAQSVNEGVLLTWSFMSISGAEFDLFRRHRNGGAWLKLNDVPINGNSFLDRTAQSGVGYVFRLVMKVHGGEDLYAEVWVDGCDPYEAVLFDPHPNPFNSVTRVGFSIGVSAFVEVEVYDLLGRKVRTLMKRRVEPGLHEVILNAERMASGTYFLRMTAEQTEGVSLYSAAKRLVIVK